MLNKYLDLIPTLQKRYEEAPSRYEELSTTISPKAKIYEWTNGCRYSIRPIAFVLNGPQGRIYKRKPKLRGGVYRYSYSTDGEILIEEHYTEFEGQIYEAFREKNESGDSSTLYDDYSPEKRCINIEQLYGDSNTPQAYIRYAKHGVLVETYQYESNRIIKVHQQNKMHNPKLPPNLSFRRELVFAYQGETVWNISATHEDGQTYMLVDNGTLL